MNYKYYAVNFLPFFSDVEQSFEILDPWVFLELFCFIMSVWQITTGFTAQAFCFPNSKKISFPPSSSDGVSCCTLISNAMASLSLSIYLNKKQFFNFLNQKLLVAK